MMQETTLDEHAPSSMIDKSQSHTASNTTTRQNQQIDLDNSLSLLQRDIGRRSTSGVCSRNEAEDVRTMTSNSRVDQVCSRDDEEEKKQGSDNGVAVAQVPLLIDAGTTVPRKTVPMGARNLKKLAKTSQPEEKNDNNKKLRPQHIHRASATSSSSKPQDYLRHVTTDGTKKAGTSWWERVVVQRSSYVVEDLVEQYTADSAFLQSEPFTVAWLDRIEVETGDLLGAGTYSNVSRVKNLQLLPDFLKDHDQQDQLRRYLVAKSKANSTPATIAKTAAAAKEATTDGNEESSPPTPTLPTGYAIKHLKAELLQNSKLFEAAAADLIMEAKFLSRLSHPNILRLRGMALGGSSTFAATGLFDSYFLVVDELQETLIQRIHRWKVQGSTDQYQHDMVVYKLKLAVQVASALAYLHERRLVFRDLKPHNIGLKGDGDTVQLFDFGFCRELPNPSSALSRPPPTMQGSTNPATQTDNQMLQPERRSMSSDDDEDDKLYCMSGKGTLLYMSPEVLSSRCYNRKADVYSWSMVTYELLTLQKPFAVGSIEQHKKAVCEQGGRPPLHHLRWLSAGVKELLQHSWQANVLARWNMKDVKEALDDIIREMGQSGFAAATAFAKDASFGYSTTGNFFCQGAEIDSIIMDITNTMQTRYQAITDQIFCRVSKTDVASTFAVAGSPSKDPITKGPRAPVKMRLSTLTEEITPKASSSTGSNRAPAFPVSAAHDRLFSGVSFSAALLGAASPRMPQTSEQFPMTSLAMNSVRLNAARSRQITGSSASSSSRITPSSSRGASQSVNDLRGKGGSGRLRGQSKSINLGADGLETSAQNILQTIKSEDNSSGIDEVSWEEDDRMTRQATARMEAMGAADGANESIRLPNSEAEYPSIHFGAPMPSPRESFQCPSLNIGAAAGERAASLSLHAVGTNTGVPGTDRAVSLQALRTGTGGAPFCERAASAQAARTSGAVASNDRAVSLQALGIKEKEKLGNPQDDQGTAAEVYIVATASV